MFSVNKNLSRKIRSLSREIKPIGKNEMDILEQKTQSLEFPVHNKSSANVSYYYYYL